MCGIIFIYINDNGGNEIACSRCQACTRHVTSESAPPTLTNTVDNALTAISHRGPHSRELWTTWPVSLGTPRPPRGAMGHCRLAVVNRANRHGDQPFWLPVNETGCSGDQPSDSSPVFPPGLCKDGGNGSQPRVAISLLANAEIYDHVASVEEVCGDGVESDNNDTTSAYLPNLMPAAHPTLGMRFHIDHGDDVQDVPVVVPALATAPGDSDPVTHPSSSTLPLRSPSSCTTDQLQPHHPAPISARTSDCAAILAAYCAYGMPDMLRHIHGMYAFVISEWAVDGSLVSVVAARDPFGIKPLYYCCVGEPTMEESVEGRGLVRNIVIASELKAFDAIPSLSSCSMATAHEIPAGSFLSATPSAYPLSPTARQGRPLPHLKVDVQRFFHPDWLVPSPISSPQSSPPFHPPRTSAASETTTPPTTYAPTPDTSTPLLGRGYNPTPECAIAVRSALLVAVQRRLGNNEGPVAVLLSGGLDSSLIAALVASELKRTHRPSSDLHTFNIAYLPQEDEVAKTGLGPMMGGDASAAANVASWIGSVHHEIEFTSADGLAYLGQVVHHLESWDVIAIRAALPLFLLAREVARLDFRVVLCGEGADEVFGGYSLFAAYDAHHQSEFDAELRRRLAHIGSSELQRVDRMTMAHGLEARVPFLDEDFADVCMTHISTAAKLSHPSLGRIEKYFLRACFDDGPGRHGLLPDSVLYRTKAQFADGIGQGWITALQTYAWAEMHRDAGKEATPPPITAPAEPESISSPLQVETLPPTSQELDRDRVEALFYRRLFDDQFSTMSAAAVRKTHRLRRASCGRKRDRNGSDINRMTRSAVDNTVSSDAVPFVANCRSARHTVAQDPDLCSLLTQAEADQFLRDILHLSPSSFHAVDTAIQTSTTTDIDPVTRGSPDVPTVARPGTLERLRILVQAMLERVPFQNITMLVGPRRPPTPREIKLDMMRGWGGPCYVVQSFFAALLHRLGFDVSLTPCTIHRPDCHIGLFVYIRGLCYWVDVANGTFVPSSLPIRNPCACSTASLRPITDDD
eukprot:TRINITY_DN1048_c0_g1_i1.p1 TRINITY_DN1048_c0_g1~~TRINITY_DN1048_c0_g1_i1.p1  ORF type:complete len:1031 (-),score=83.84 TRINITY_DN1048_c0_g1_i1:664-3756(-)